MNKRIACLTASVMLAVLLVFSALTVYAAPSDEFGAYDDSAQTDDFSDFEDSTEENAGEETEDPATSEPATQPEYPALTVNAISNYFPKSTAEYNADEKEIKVTYWFNCSKPILSTQWLMVYDPEVLSFSEQKNTPRTICPAFDGQAVITHEDNDTIKCSSSNIQLFDLTSTDKPFVEVVFDVRDINFDDPVSTKVDLTVDMLRVSELDQSTGVSDYTKEISLVENCDVESGKLAATVSVSKNISLTESTFIEPTTAQPTTAEQVTDADGNVISSGDEPETTVEPTESPTASTDPTSATVQSSTAASVPTAIAQDGEKKEPADENNAIVETGSPVKSIIILSVLIVFTSILFVMRKKEMFM